jgi:TIR domain
VAGGSPGSDSDALEFFVSYTRSDQRWAEWIAWTLEEVGHQVVVQEWDFVAGSHFVTEMQKAVRRATRTIAVLSHAYQASAFAAQEWQAAWAADPDGQSRRLLVVRIEDCPPEGLLGQVVGVDVFGVDRDTARTRVLDAVTQGRRKPVVEPPFPAHQTVRQKEPPLPRPAAVWEMPWPRNPNFTGRTSVLAVLRERFTRGTPARSGLPQVLQGLGGVGKTQLAVEYAYRHAADYDLVWWLDAEQPGQIMAGLSALMAQLDDTDRGESLKSAAGAAIDLLRRGDRFPRWLVIADNAGTVSGLSGLLAAAGRGGHVLITSRDPGWAGSARLLELDVLSRTEAIALLKARTPTITNVDADQIAAALGDLPLALEQAGAWLRESGMTITDYLHALRYRTQEILAEGKPNIYPAPVAATWTLAVDALDDQSAPWLLAVWAALGPEPIPTDLITRATVADLPTPLADLGDPLRSGQIIRKVSRLGLIR